MYQLNSLVPEVKL